MKHVSMLLFAACLVLAVPSAQAAAADELYVRVFGTILQGDALREGGQGKAALEKYLTAQEDLKKVQSAYKTWEPKLVDFRLKYLEDWIGKLSVQFPGTIAPKPAVTAVQMSDDAGAAKLTGLEKQLRARDGLFFKHSSARAGQRRRARIIRPRVGLGPEP